MSGCQPDVDHTSGCQPHFWLRQLKPFLHMDDEKNVISTT